MFKENDFGFLNEACALARAKTVDLDINNKMGLLSIIKFEEDLKKKMTEANKLIENLDKPKEEPTTK